MATRTIPLSSKELDSAIEVLAGAGQALQLSRFARFSYYALMISADVTTAIMVASLLMDIEELFIDHLKLVPRAVQNVLWNTLYISLTIALISLALNVPLFLRSFRDAARLKVRGLSSLSDFLWKESRRSHLINKVREVLLVLVGLDVLCNLYLVARVTFFSNIPHVSETREKDIAIYFIAGFIFVLFLVMIFAILIGARYLRNQRERMDLTASAKELSKALQGLRQHAKIGTVSVPAELLEQTAKIEATQIAEQRKDAVLESAAFRPNAYAISFDGDAAEQRATLDTADRVELENLVAQLSIDGRATQTAARSSHW